MAICRDIIAEYSANYVGLERVNRTIPAHRLAIRSELLDYIIAVRVAAARFAHLDPATLTATDLVRQILQEERVHRALQADVQMRDLALGEGDDLHVRIGHAFE